MQNAQLDRRSILITWAFVMAAGLFVDGLVFSFVVFVAIGGGAYLFFSQVEAGPVLRRWLQLLMGWSLSMLIGKIGIIYYVRHAQMSSEGVKMDPQEAYTMIANLTHWMHYLPWLIFIGIAVDIVHRLMTKHDEADKHETLRKVGQEKAREL